jgi:hypothetical protein
MINKKGEKLLSLYWFLILTIIVVGVVIMVKTFYGNPYDVRTLEAEILNNHISNCISSGGRMNTLLIWPGTGQYQESFKDTFPDKCKIDLAGHNEFDPIEYYVEVNLYNKFEKKSFATFFNGNKNWIGDCQASNQYKNLAVCFNSTFYSSDNVGNLYRVEVLTIVHKIKENVKQN